MLCHWPCLEHQLEHHGLEMLVLLYHDHCNMLCTMESFCPKQHIILLSHSSTNYTAKALLSNTWQES